MNDQTQSTTSLTIAIATDDGDTISQHFGRARYFEVVCVEQGVITHRERREKAGHHTATPSSHHHEQGPAQHGVDPASQNRHASMADTIKDCQIVLTRGMGNGAYQSMIQNNIKPIVTDIQSIEQAVLSVAAGTIVNHLERLH